MGMEKVRLGIIGMGGMGCKYASMLLQGEIPRMELAAVTRIGRRQGEWAKTELPEGLPVFQTAEELLSYEKLDGVLIATPHYDHERQTVEAFKRGLHVMCEKPSGVYTLQAEHMNEEASKQGLVFGMMFQKRTEPIYRKLRELVNSGEYGEIRRVSWIITDWYRPESYYQDTPWRGTWKTDGGGILLNQCPHNLDLLQWICGMPGRIQGFCQEGKWHRIEVEDEVTAYMEFPNGATGTFVASTGDYPGVNRLEIDLEKAQIICEGGKLHIQGRKEHKSGDTAEALSMESYSMDYDFSGCTSGNHYQIMLHNFADAILDGAPLIADGKEGINSLMMSNAIYLSSWQRRMLNLPIDSGEFLKELNKRIGSE